MPINYLLIFAKKLAVSFLILEFARIVGKQE
jgi:hypothetical protein